MEDGVERTKIKSESLREEHERKQLREQQRHDNVMEELKFMAEHNITMFNRLDKVN